MAFQPSTVSEYIAVAQGAWMDNSVRSCFYTVYVQYCTSIISYTPLQVLCGGWMYSCQPYTFHGCRNICAMNSWYSEQLDMKALNLQHQCMGYSCRPGSQHILIEFMSYLSCASSGSLSVQNGKEHLTLGHMQWDFDERVEGSLVLATKLEK